MKIDIFKYLKPIFLLFVSTAVLSSCLLDDDETDFGTGPDFITFARTEVTAPFETDGEAKTYNLTIDLRGPGRETFKGDITVNIEIDNNKTTAVDGVNYSLPTTSVVLNEENEYSTTIPVTIFTAGIQAPEEKVLAFNITTISSDSNKLVISDTGKTSVVNISYICFADLNGTYIMTNSVCDPQVSGITITKNEEGGWDLSTADGGLLQYCTSNSGLVNSGSIIIVCGEVLASDDLSFCGNYGIGCITGGTWDENSGTLTLQHNDALFGYGDYTSTYIKQ
ncbi:DUF1735 domain-containing protein [Abyssalbus ytuae]|uniref:DUF1735 domain-containing protein n=1 Tax=Abyssalbus ytuae TaxID=2926907 RepID=A0A9E6ZPF6_9FLAO|nr:DUF1735 domain-containing protein [Abyssalbus ytuae]UOB18469.1 DUF1735 domain-containing protein [Abyssalbus ytuae]